MTMQAMAMVGSPVTSPPTSPITSPPMSPLLHHPPSPYAPTSPYVVIPPSPYANIPPSPYANFSPTPYAAANIPSGPLPPTVQPAAQPQAHRPNPQPSATKTKKTEPAQPKDNAAAQVSNPETCEVTVQNDICIMIQYFLIHKSCYGSCCQQQQVTLCQEKLDAQNEMHKMRCSVRL